MQKRTVKIEVNQVINYHTHPDRERFELATEGELIELATYSKLSYVDNDRVNISVKWQREDIGNHLTVEIKQPTYNLVFHPERLTYSPYRTPQGIWKLEVNTTRIEETHEADQVTLAVDYQISLGEETLGDYQFRLIYQA